MILKYAPQKECLNILDVGTDRAFAIILQKEQQTAGFNTRYVDKQKKNANYIKWKLNLNYWKINFNFPDKYI